AELEDAEALLVGELVVRRVAQPRDERDAQPQEKTLEVPVDLRVNGGVVDVERAEHLLQAILYQRVLAHAVRHHRDLAFLAGDASDEEQLVDEARRGADVGGRGQDRYDDGLRAAHERGELRAAAAGRHIEDHAVRAARDAYAF